MPTTLMNTTRISTATLIVTLPFINGCAMLNVKQIAYEVLAQEDCRRNQLESFCARGFAREYHEYEQTRQEFMRSETESPWRAEAETMVGRAK